jgi:hypothetical protein
MKTNTRHFLLVITVLVSGHLLIGCRPSSQITGSWKSPDATGNAYRKVLVAALTNNAADRQTVETELVDHLLKKGVRATRSIDVFPPSFTQGKLPPRGEIIDKIRQTGHDAVLTASLLDSGTETHYVPNSIAYAPMGAHIYYNNFYGYYSHHYSAVYSPGYYVATHTYFLETNFYDVATEKLLWSAQSETYDPSSIGRFSKNFAKLTMGRLSKDGIL